MVIPALLGRQVVGLPNPARDSFRRGTEPSSGWLRHPNLRRRPHAPNKGRGRLAAPDQARIHCARGQRNGHLSVVPALAGPEARAARTLVDRAHPRCHCRSPRSRLDHRPPLDLAPQDARGGYPLRVVRPKSLRKLADGRSCPYCRPCSAGDSQRLFTGGLGPLDHVGTVSILSPIN